ncbi:MAG TPA: cytochrome c oxidase assembly factor Coa1 family protein [Pyrinomonadaceae bacterium]|nr:cytochrome c oxidase assembly factor Coa1 family protein [Pyrinomonadaceae bacterium]
MTTKKIVLIVLGVVVVLGFVVVLFVGGIVGFVFYQLGNSDAAEQARQYLRTNEKLKADIGEVKDFGSIVTGSINMEGGSGEARLTLKVIGERQTVNAVVELTLVRGGKWRVIGAAYANASGETIELLNPYDTKLLVPRLIA